MLKLSKLTDYATVIVAYIARKGGTHTARDLAVATHIALPTVSKIVKQLTRQHLLHSARGVQGGYGLSQAPEEITLVEIITAMETRVAITECSRSEHHCELERSCQIRSHWRLISDAMTEALATITIADLTSPLTRIHFNVDKRQAKMPPTITVRD